ncbi:transposase [Tabrizicola sp.]|uniref:REP-associated tyrosine transposase n=1 Tax=Tabrizicola sp. TaxID=2005166 RepID=UPI0027353737|nr:transposase [Tabrizicola sp.]MDP3195096.1 transposase [Tabrizicola sp.]
MSNYRRLRVPGATYFFTVNLAERGGAALVDHIDLLREAYRVTTTEQPIRCEAMVILPDHIHAVWTLPPGDADFSRRWQKIKGRFTHASGLRGTQSRSIAGKREAGLWQRRFWEHMLRDAEEERRAIAYCLTDPVRHGLVTRPEEWPFSTIHRDLRAKVGESPTLQAVA